MDDTSITRILLENKLSGITVEIERITK